MYQPVPIPDRWLAEPDDALRGQASFVEAPSRELSGVEDVRARLQLANGNGGWRFAPKHPHAQLAGTVAVPLDAVEMTADCAATEVLVHEHVDRNVGRLGELRHRVVRDVGATPSIPEERHEQDDGLRRQMRHGQSEIAHRQLGEVFEGETVLECPQLVSRQLQQVPVERRSPSDDHDMTSLRLQPKGDVERRREGAFQKNACDVGWKRDALDVGRVGAAEDDWDAGKGRVPVPQQKTERWSHHTDDEVQFLVAILARIMLAQHLLVLLVGELRKVHRLGEELHTGSEPGADRRTQALVQNGEAREGLVLVVQEENALVLRGRHGARQQGDQAENSSTESGPQTRADRHTPGILARRCNRGVTTAEGYFLTSNSRLFNRTGSVE